jgi:poly(3-hydroxybutyrate) depolymerase
MMIGGMERTYLLYAPLSYDPCTSAALVVDAHGAQESAEVHAGLADFYNWPTKGIGSGFRLVADREGFLVATPQGIGNAWAQSDTEFITAIPAVVGVQATVDKARVYLSGISNGGGLTYWTACGGSGVFHGYAPISGFDNSACPVTHPAPLVQFHSPTDALVSYSAGQAAFQHWRDGNHCTTTPTASLSFGGANGDPRPFCLAAGDPWQLVTCDASAPATTCDRYTGCDSGDAVFCTVPPDNQYDGGQTGGHILYFNATKLSLAAVSWAIFEM